MADRQFLRLNDDWALAFDNRQWVIQRRNGAEGWLGRKYIGPSVADLRRAIAVLKIRVSRAAAVELDRLPATFGAFLDQQGIDRPEDDMRSKRHGRSREKQLPPAPPKVPHSAISLSEASDHPKTPVAPVSAPESAMESIDDRAA